MTIVMGKEEAHRLVDRMPGNATWEDLVHEIYVREAVERGSPTARLDAPRT